MLTHCSEDPLVQILWCWFVEKLGLGSVNETLQAGQLVLGVQCVDVVLEGVWNQSVLHPYVRRPFDNVPFFSGAKDAKKEDRRRLR